MGATNIYAKLAGDEGLDEGGDAVANQMYDIVVPYSKLAADGAAATATTDQFLFNNQTGGSLLVVGGSMTTIGAGITADNTNYASIALKKDDGIGGASVVALSINTQITDSGNFTSLVSKAFTTKSATPANLVIAPGANVYFAITKPGSGVVVPISGYTFRFRKIG